MCISIIAAIWMPQLKRKPVRHTSRHRVNPQDEFDSLRQRLIGQRVTDRQLAGNSLSVWIATEPGKDAGCTVWFEPSWHVVGPAGVVAGSRQAQDEEDPGGWDTVTEKIDALVGATVETIERDPNTGDLELTLSNGYRVRSFVTDPRDGFLWRFRDLSTKRRIIGSPTGIQAEDAKGA